MACRRSNEDEKMSDIVNDTPAPVSAPIRAQMTIYVDDWDRLAARVVELEAECWRMKEDRDRALGWRDHDKAEVLRLRLALEEIAERHIPVQPSACGMDEADYNARQYRELRYMARCALK
jgi:hypothetical protein